MGFLGIFWLGSKLSPLRKALGYSTYYAYYVSRCYLTIAILKLVGFIGVQKIFPKDSNFWAQKLALFGNFGAWGHYRLQALPWRSSFCRESCSTYLVLSKNTIGIIRCHRCQSSDRFQGWVWGQKPSKNDTNIKMVKLSIFWQFFDIRKLQTK